MSLDLERVRTLLVEGEIRWSLHYEPSCSSTQDLARSAAKDGADQGWTVITDLQLEGRGRSGRQWVAPDGTALLFSTILHPPVDVLPLLPLLAALSVAGGIELATGVVAELKWPNDVLVNDHKLAGILLEHPGGAAVVLGVGVNVNPLAADLPERATSLIALTGHSLDREPLLAAILNDLANAYDRADREGVGWIVPGWRSRSSMLGKPVAFQRDSETIRGVAEDLGVDGALLVRLDDGTRLSVIAGEVERLRPA
jgi:BirA family transcriptional regulator, biotin operon repressor / biotin---[acetyl-CoA-carboxylase] ligase